MRSRLITPDHEQHLGFPNRDGEAHSPQHSHADIDRKLNGIPEPGRTAPTGLLWGGPASTGVSQDFARSDHAHSYPAYPTPTGPHCEITRATDQECVNGADTVVLFNSTFNANVDLRDAHRIRIQQPGRYLVWACIMWYSMYADFNTGGYRSCHIRLNGTTVLVDDHKQFPENGNLNPNPTHNLSRVVELAVNDYLEVLMIHQHSLTGANLGIFGGLTYAPFFGACFQTV